MARTGLSQRITLSAMVIALNILSLYASEALSGMRLFFCFISALPVQVLLTEDLKLESWLSFLATVLLGFLLCPDRYSWFFYVALLGHYGMMRAFFRRYVNRVWVRGLCLVLYCNIGCALALWVLNTVAGVPYTALIRDSKLSFPPVILILFVEAAFFLLEGLYEGFCRIYVTKLRARLFTHR